MIAIQKIVVSLWRAFAEQMHQHCWKKRHWKSFWVSETAKILSPKNRPPVSVIIDTDYCCCRGKALGGAKMPR